MKRVICILCVILLLLSSRQVHAAGYSAKDNYLIAPSGLALVYLIPQKFSSIKAAKKYIKKVEFLDDTPKARKFKGMKVIHGDYFVYFIDKRDSECLIFRSEWMTHISKNDIAMMKKVTIKEDDSDANKISLVITTD